MPSGLLAAGVDYQYDPLGRLTAVVFGDDAEIRYRYDPAGNRIEQAVLADSGPDTDGDGDPDATDPDDDNDGVDDAADAFPLDPGEHSDGDGDGVGDNADPHDDASALVAAVLPTVDGQTGDWLGIGPAVIDAAGDQQGEPSTDILEVAVAIDSDRLTVRLQAMGPILFPHSPAHQVSYYALNLNFSPDGDCGADAGLLAISAQASAGAETRLQADRRDAQGGLVGSYPVHGAFDHDTLEMALATTAIPTAARSVRIEAGTGSSTPDLEHDRAGPSACLQIDGTRLHQAAMQRVYVAYYGRPADPSGARWWGEQLADNGGDLGAVIQQFGHSPEFDARYGGLDDGTLLDTIYRQMFGRDPDPAGKAFYQERLATGAMTLQSITLDVLNGARNQDLQTIANRLEVASHFTAQVAARLLPYGTDDIDTARGLLDRVSADMGSVPGARQAADEVLEAMGGVF